MHDRLLVGIDLFLTMLVKIHLVNCHNDYDCTLCLCTFMQVNENGILSFRESYSTPFPMELDDDQSLPLIPLIAPFWSDVDIRQGFTGEIFYRRTNDSMTIQHAMDFIQSAIISPYIQLTFNPTDLFIATWDQVASSNAVEVCAAMQCIQS